MPEPTANPKSTGGPALRHERGAPGRVHLASLDGLRGLASLYVAFGHAYLVYSAETTMVTPPQRGALADIGWAFDFPQMAVAIFIVLSGYCLMAPLARQHQEGQPEQWRLKNLGNYFYRRARRILPPYYAAMALTLAGIWLFPALSHTDATTNFWGQALPAFRADVLVAHLLMIFNWSGDWVHKISPPFWSVATEWQIYFLFPLLFLPLLRRTGRAALVLLVPAAFLVGFIPHLVLAKAAGGRFGIGEAHPWYTGLFAMGMTAAIASLTPQVAGVGALLRRFGGWLALAGLAAFATLQAWDPLMHRGKYVPFDLAYGIAAMGFLIFLTRGCVNPASDNAVARTLRTLLGALPLKKLGDMSYSLYLIHAPILVLVHRWTAAAGWQTSPARVLAIMLGIAAPLSLLIAAGFHMFFERPFMSRAPRPTLAALPEAVPA